MYRKHDAFDTWEEIEKTEYDLAIADMHGTWMDVTINDDTTWTEVGDLTWESVDWNTYANQENLFDYLDGEVVNTASEEVGNVIGITPSKQQVRIKGINNSLFTNNRRQNAYFFKDRTKSNVLLLDIIANAAGITDSVKTFTNNGIQFLNSLQGFIVGNYGKLLYTEDGGSIWQALDSDTVNNLNDLFFIDARNGWIVGNYGTILHYVVNPSGSRTITRESIATTKNLNSVHFINEDVGYVAGDSVILKTVNGGGIWESITPNGFGEIITSIYFPDTTIGVFVTESGNIYRTTDSGQNWSIVNSTTGKCLALYFIDNKHGWVTSSDGTTNHKIFITVNGGLTWTESSVPIPIS